jgi:2-polyprenyl-6-methoxyphenol hydroxylase-like FAD-dependent oxidoreductase
VGYERVIVAGGGVAGLGTALSLARAGREVLLFERDPLREASSADEAFDWERPGAPQTHQTHGFLARIVVLMRQRFPDLLEALQRAGCSTVSGTSLLGEARPGDEDLSLLLVRRTTFEWILRRAVDAAPGIELRSDVGAAGLLAATGPAAPVPIVGGVVLDDGTEVRADAVVAATGRRGDVPAWLAPLGVRVPETIRQSGLVYLTRWYRVSDSFATPPGPKLGGDLGYLKYLIVPGDGGMLSATLAVRSDDGELRRALSDPTHFERACRALPGPDQWFGELDLEPVGGVRPMGGLMNRLRCYTDAAGQPVVHNFHAVGDAHTCTNPLYGRGCSLALLQAVLLADAVAAHDAPREIAAAYEAACRDEVQPWFHHAVETDRGGADPAQSHAPEAGGDRFGAVLAAGQTDPVIGRAMARLWNLLTKPAELSQDPEFMARATAIMADPDTYPTPVPAGPSRHVLLETVAA